MTTAIDMGQAASKRVLQIDIPAHWRATFEQPVASPHAPESAEFKAQMGDYAARYEEDYKSSSQWLEKDTRRDVTWMVEPREDGGYTIFVSFTIVGAVARVMTQADAVAEPDTPAFDAWLAEQATLAEQAWLSERTALSPL